MREKLMYLHVGSIFHPMPFVTLTNPLRQHRIGRIEPYHSVKSFRPPIQNTFSPLFNAAAFDAFKIECV